MTDAKDSVTPAANADAADPVEAWCACVAKRSALLNVRVPSALARAVFPTADAVRKALALLPDTTRDDVVRDLASEVKFLASSNDDGHHRGCAKLGELEGYRLLSPSPSPPPPTLAELLPPDHKDVDACADDTYEACGFDTKDCTADQRDCLTFYHWLRSGVYDVDDLEYAAEQHTSQTCFGMWSDIKAHGKTCTAGSSGGCRMCLVWFMEDYDAEVALDFCRAYRAAHPPKSSS